MTVANRIQPASVYAQPNGHWSSTRLATPEELRSGVLCEAKPAGTSIRLDLAGERWQLHRVDNRIVLSRHSPAFVLPLYESEAKALAGALAQCIGPLDVPGIVATAHADVTVHHAPGYAGFGTVDCPCAGCRAARNAMRREDLPRGAEMGEPTR